MNAVAHTAAPQPQPIIVRSKCAWCGGLGNDVPEPQRCVACAGRGYVLVEVDS